MARNTKHALQPQTDHDGNSRRLAVLAMKRALRAGPEARLKQDFEQGKMPIESQESYRLWASANRASQDRMWFLLADQVDGEYSRISAVAADLTLKARGSLSLDPDMGGPEYLRQANIHGQVGGYLLERDAADLAAGILYEAGGNLYAMGQGIGARDSKGQRLVAHIRETYPEFMPKRILEMGCSAGGQSTDYPAAFPDAEFHALDVSPAMLRYAHARAEALGAAVNFHQADAANTPFPDACFDLVISHNLFHEVAGDHMPGILRECHRLLKPGGVCIHQDVPIQTRRFNDWMRFISEWQKDHNDEPFWLDFANANLPAMLVEAGFSEEAVSETYLEALDGPIPWYVVSALRR